jgi:L-ornithine Nalpha-acyltransferase
MLALLKGRYTARLAESAADIQAAKALRYQCFVKGRPADMGQGIDEDHFDDSCLQLLIEEAGSAQLACTYRLLPLAGGQEIHLSYAAQRYDLTRLSDFTKPMLELGRFCVAPGRQPDADLLRVAWGAIARLVDAQGVGMLFGCSSFAGANGADHHDALQALARK